MSENRFDTSKLDIREFKARLDYLELTELTDTDARLLQSLSSWADSVAGDFAKKFYDRQFKQAGFVKIVEAAGSNRQRLEGAQAAYMKSLFDGLPDAQYIAMRQHIGSLHARIDVTPDWYISSYQWYAELLYPMVRSKLRLKRGAANRAVLAISKLLLFDQAIIMDEYVKQVVELARERQEMLDKENTELQRLDRSKNEFLSGLSHELKTPLAAMLGFTNILSRNSDKRLDPDHLDKLNRIDRNGRRLDTLIADLLDLSKIESKQITLSIESINVAELIDEVRASFEIIVSGKGQSLVAESDHGPAWITGDRGRIYQVVSNLVSNASKYSEKGAEIVIRSETLAKRLFVSVIDEGPGLEKQDQDRLFDLFYRTAEAEKSATPGTGIGLYICRKIVEMHGGEISVVSERGSGATFTVKLPGVEYTAPVTIADDRPRFQNRLADLPATA
ncbi:MAG: ATP-binding protein [Chloroflexi bacterium]|nr:ATP-binding protein [Chloroflexota bacterium]